MLKYYNYLYYRFYLLFANRKSDYVEAKWTAMTLTALLISINLSTFFSEFVPLSDDYIFLKSNIDIYTLIFFCILNYFIFIYKNKYLKIVEYYKNESKYQAKRGKVIAWIIICFTCSQIFYFIWIK